MELSIVLVILGLLVGGVMSGQSLIKAAELRAVTSEFQQHQTAVNVFKDKYFALPGDMTNATAFWDYPASTPANCPATAGTGTETCDGDGDGDIEFGATSEYGEEFTFWQHLANAGLLEGTYTGMAGPGSAADAVLGENVPHSKFGTAGWGARTGVSGSPGNYDVNYGNAFMFGADTVPGPTYAAVLTPEDAWNIDTKMDDGKPATGMVIARYWNDVCGAADDGTHANDDLVASYKLSDDSVRCALFFRNAF